MCVCVCLKTRLRRSPAAGVSEKAKSSLHGASPGREEGRAAGEQGWGESLDGLRGPDIRAKRLHCGFVTVEEGKGYI